MTDAERIARLETALARVRTARDVLSDALEQLKRAVDDAHDVTPTSVHVAPVRK